MRATRSDGLEILDSLGARPAGSLLRARLRDAGAESIPRGPIRETQENPANLTPRQLEVTRLIVDGVNNAQIADQAFISKKTVEHHVSAIFSKLGVESRGDVIRVASELLAEE